MDPLLLDAYRIVEVDDTYKKGKELNVKYGLGITILLLAVYIYIVIRFDLFIKKEYLENITMRKEILVYIIFVAFVAFMFYYYRETFYLSSANIRPTVCSPQCPCQDANYIFLDNGEPIHTFPPESPRRTIQYSTF